MDKSEPQNHHFTSSTVIIAINIKTIDITITLTSITIMTVTNQREKWEARTRRATGR